jgi:uroporphyrinogen decarboxylase
MTPKERLMAVKEGKKTDRPAFAAWGPHMNLVDRNAKDFAEATIQYQNAYHFDFIKLMPNGMYFTEDFGQKLKRSEHIFDDTWMNVEAFTVNDPHQWTKIRVPDLKKGALAREIEVCRRVNDYFQGDVPVLATVFSPFIWMGEMTGGFFHPEVILNQFRYSENYVKPALEIIAETNERLMEAFVDAGAAGFFLGYQCGMAKLMGKEMFDEYARKYDVSNINAVKNRTWFNMAHICHGDAATSEWYLDYPVDAFNWADQDQAMHSIGEMRKLTDKVLVGGLDHANGHGYRDLKSRYLPSSDFAGTDREVVKAHLKDKIRAALQAGGAKTVISGGCGWSEGSLPRFPLWKEAMEEIGQEPAEK